MKTREIKYHSPIDFTMLMGSTGFIIEEITRSSVAYVYRGLLSATVTH